MFTNNMPQAQTTRRPQPTSKSRPVRPAVPTYDRATSLKHSAPSRHSRRPSTGSSSVGKRRSSSLSRHPNYQLQSSSPHYQHNNGRMSPQFHSYRPENSDTESVASAPSLKFHRELRDPTSTTGRPIPRGRHFRDDSSLTKATSDTSHKHVKMARKVIEDLNRASETGTYEKRIAAITNACAEFDHADDIKHNVELQNGAANVLTKILSITEDEDEIRMVCAATEMVFRAQTTYVHVAFDKCGSVMIPNLLRIMERAENGHMKHAGKCILKSHVCTCY